MTDQYLVKGSSIRSKFEYVRARFGPAAEEELRNSFESRPKLFPLLDSSWYPFSTYDEINRAIANRFHNNDLKALRDVGVFSANQALTTVYKAFARDGDFVSFLRRISSLHETLYNQGDTTMTLGGDDCSCVIRHSGAPVYSDADLEVAAGFYLGAGRLFGHSNITCDLRRESSGVRFELRWN